MRDVLPELIERWNAGETVGIATVVATFRSAPRLPGAAMLVCPDGSAVGSVSGGCVEGAVYDLAQATVRSGAPVLQRYGVSDEDAFGVGLTCGGTLDIYIEAMSQATFPELGDIAADAEAGRPVALACIVDHPEASHIGRKIVVRPQSVEGDLGSRNINTTVRRDVLGYLAQGKNGIIAYGPEGQPHGDTIRVFVTSFAPAPRMIVFGAIDFAAAVARAGSFLGYHVTICDARPVFTTSSRFPDADEVIVDWPHRYLKSEVEAGRIDDRTVITVLTHDPKFDIPLLEVALKLPAVGYVGALGSRRTDEDRRRRLQEAGLNSVEIGRLYSPIGLDLGGNTPEETAISIVAEVIANKWNGSGARLSATELPIHRSHQAGSDMSEVKLQ
ncbi:XdhC family protein [Arthrobacter sp. Rue61a]|nr:XdhC family protein [Arthrobacter sp. Rue61a]AFR34512.1 putative XdhC protein [Arthrobacter sp. Rue61a]